MASVLCELHRGVGQDYDSGEAWGSPARISRQFPALIPALAARAMAARENFRVGDLELFGLNGVGTAVPKAILSVSLSRLTSMGDRKAVNLMRDSIATSTWLAVALCSLCCLSVVRARDKLAKTADDSNLAAAICPIVYPLDQYPSEKGYHYLFYGNAFFVNEEGYLITAAHVLESFRNGGQPNILVALPTGSRRLVRTELVASDREHDVAVLRAIPNPFAGEYRVAFLPLATEEPPQGKSVLSVSLRPSSLQDAYTFDEPLEDHSQGEILGYQYTQGERGRKIEVLLYSQNVTPGQSGSPVISGESGEAVGLIEGRWQHPRAIPFVTKEEQVDPSPGVALRIHYAIALLERHDVPWHAALEPAGHREGPAENPKGFSPPAPLTLVAGPYPAQVLFGGEILLDAQVSTKGRLTDVKVVQGQSPFLEEVLATVRTWIFLPARSNGHLVESRIGIVFQFPQSFLPALTARVHEHKQAAASDNGRAALPTYTLEPEYPPNSLGEGSVVLYQIVDSQGRVTSTHVLRDLASLTQPTVAAVNQWRFVPAKRDGENVEAGVIVVVTFRRPFVAKQTRQLESGRASCGVSMRGRCLFRQKP